MPPISITLCLIFIEMHMIKSWPVAFETVHFKKTNSTPVRIEEIRKKLMAPSLSISNLLHETEKTANIPVQLVSKKNLTKPESDSIIFRDFDNSTLGEGSPCTRSHDGATGYCLLAKQCRRVFREFRISGTEIDVCGYADNTAIVCCPFGRRPPDKPIKQQPVRRISARKCQEYGQLGAIRSAFMRLVANPIILKNKSKPTCRFPIPLIVGGESATPGEFPHMAAIGWQKPNGQIKWSCGGTLISEKFILTAAHCGKMAGASPTIVRLGEHNLRSANDGATSKDFAIRQIITHPKYNSNFYYNDIALIELDRNVEFTRYIRPACLWQSAQVKMAKVTATGWGRLGFHGRKAKNLQKVKLSIVDKTTCNGSFNIQKELYNGIVDSQICAGHMEGGKDTCQGDSGGPLQILMEEQHCMYHVIGVTSFGKFCAAPNMPGVYTNVYSYLDWIESHAFE